MALAAFWKFKLEMRVVLGWDIIHELVNTVDRALTSAGWWPVVLELLIAWRLPWGPWQSLGFWQKLRQAARASVDIVHEENSFITWLGHEIDKELDSRDCLATVWDTKGTKHES